MALGEVTHEDVWPDICRAVGQALPPQTLTDAFNSTPANRPMFELARRLRAACRVAIITDNKLDRMHRLIACSGSARCSISSSCRLPKACPRSQARCSNERWPLLVRGATRLRSVRKTYRRMLRIQLAPHGCRVRPPSGPFWYAQTLRTGQAIACRGAQPLGSPQRQRCPRRCQARVPADAT